MLSVIRNGIRRLSAWAAGEEVRCPERRGRLAGEGEGGERVVSPSDAGRTVTRGARVPPYLDRRPLYSLTVK